MLNKHAKSIRKYLRDCGVNEVVRDSRGDEEFINRLLFDYYNKKSAVNPDTNYTARKRILRQRARELGTDVRLKTLVAPTYAEFLESDVAYVDGIYRTTLDLTSFPGRVPFGWTESLPRTDTRYDIDVYLVREDKNRFQKKAKAALEQIEFFSNGMKETDTDKNKMDNVHNLTKYYTLPRIQSGDEVFQCVVMVTIVADTLEKLLGAAGEVKSFISDRSSYNYNFEIITHQQEDAFLS